MSTPVCPFPRRASAWTSCCSAATNLRRAAPSIVAIQIIWRQPRVAPGSRSWGPALRPRPRSFRLSPISGCDLRIARPSRRDGPAWRGPRSGHRGTGGGQPQPMRPSRLSYIAYPAISGISPAIGPSAGGTRVTVHGPGLPGPHWSKWVIALLPTWDRARWRPRITVPPGQKGTVDITVTTRIGTSTPTPHDRFTYAKTAAPRH